MPSPRKRCPANSSSARRVQGKSGKPRVTNTSPNTNQVSQKPKSAVKKQIKAVTKAPDSALPRVQPTAATVKSLKRNREPSSGSSSSSAPQASTPIGVPGRTRAAIGLSVSYPPSRGNMTNDSDPRSSPILFQSLFRHQDNYGGNNATSGEEQPTCNSSDPFSVIIDTSDVTTDFTDSRPVSAYDHFTLPRIPCVTRPSIEIQVPPIECIATAPSIAPAELVHTVSYPGKPMAMPIPTTCIAFTEALGDIHVSSPVACTSLTANPPISCTPPIAITSLTENFSVKISSPTANSNRGAVDMRCNNHSSVARDVANVRSRDVIGGAFSDVIARASEVISASNDVTPVYSYPLLSSQQFPTVSVQDLSTRCQDEEPAGLQTSLIPYAPPITQYAPVSSVPTDQSGLVPELVIDLTVNTNPSTSDSLQSNSDSSWQNISCPSSNDLFSIPTSELLPLQNWTPEQYRELYGTDYSSNCFDGFPTDLADVDLDDVMDIISRN